MCKFCAIALPSRKQGQRDSCRDTPPDTLSSWGHLTPQRDRSKTQSLPNAANSQIRLGERDQ